MKRASSFVAALAATLLAVSADAATPLFSETFSGNTGDWTSSSGGASFDNQGWKCTSTCKSQSAIKLGTGSATGSATSPSIAITTGWSRASVTVSFQAAAWYGTKNCTATLSVLENNQTTTNVSWSVPPIAGTKNDALQIADLSAFTADANGKAYEVAFEARGPFQLKFETSGTSTDEKRIYLDTVVVTAEEIVSSDPVPLAMPNGLAASSVTDTGFSLSWNSVANADAYAVDVRDGNDAAAGSVTVTGTGATVTGLSADTVYSAKVQAVPAAGSTVYTNSAWSDGLSVRTGLSGGLVWAPVFLESFGGMTNTPAWGGSTKILSSEGTLDVSLTDMDAWYGNTLYDAPGAPRFGNASNKGWVQSPAISLSNGVSSATVRVTFPAIALHANAANSLVFSVLGPDGAAIPIEDVSPVVLSLPVVASPTKGSTVAEELASVGGAEQMFTFTAPAGFKLKFDTSSSTHGNVAIDDVLVRQVVDPSFSVLAVPAGVGESDVGTHGFTVSWAAVANASGYEVWLDGAVAGSCASTDTSMQLTGLSDGTAYSVQVRALGDRLRYGDSPLSTAISVTTEADADKVVFTVTGAPTGAVYAGTPVSFTVAAETESTGEPAAVSFSGIAGASFDPATGAFSWTPVLADVGLNVAVFSVDSYSTNVAISVEDPAKTEELFREDFSLFVTKWNGTSDPAAITNPPPDEAGWTFAKATRAPSSLRIGKDGAEETKAGSALSREIVLRNNLSSGTVALSFQAAAYFSKTTAMHVVVLDAETGEPVWTSPVLELAAIGTGPAKDSTLASVDEGVHANASFSVPGVPERFRLLFETVQGTAADHRLYLDSILVSQSWDASIPALAAPVPSVDAAGTDSIDVSWTAVAGSTGYDLEVRRASDGSLVARLSGVVGTGATVDGLADGTAYEVRLRALGDGVSAANSPWSAGVPAQTPADPNRPDFNVSAGADAAVTAGTAKTFSVSASRGGKTVSVSFGGLSPDPAVARSARFAGGTFSWTPTDDDAGDAGRDFTATFLVGSYSTNVVFSVLPRPPLSAPVVTVVSRRVKAATLAWNDQPRAASYGVRLWRGTTDYAKPGVCHEDFFDHVIPLGWFATGTPGTKWYQDDDAPVQFEKTGDTLITKLHSAPVTNLSFRTELNGSLGESPSKWTLYASSGETNETAWVKIVSSSPSTGDIFRAFQEEKNYRRFKWDFTKSSGNMGLGSIAAEHAGAGAKFVSGYGSAATPQDVGLSTTLSCNTLRAGTEYFLEVTATDGTESFSSVFRFSTLPAPKATIMVLR